MAVLHSLQCEYIAENGKHYETSFLAFDDAIEIYFAYQNRTPAFTRPEKDSFKQAFLHETWGLCVYLIFVERLNKRFIVLRPDSCSLEVSWTCCVLTEMPMERVTALN